MSELLIPAHSNARHGAARTKAAGGDAGGINVQTSDCGGGRHAERLGNGAAADRDETVSRADEIQWRGRGCVVRSKVEDAPGESQNRARHGVVGLAMANAFAADAIVLVSESKVHGRGGRNVGQRALGGGNSTGALEKGDIAEAKRGNACVGIGRVHLKGSP